MKDTTEAKRKSKKTAKVIAAEGKGGKKKGKRTEIDENVDAEGPITIDWSDVDLTWALISAITDDEIIRQGLFPAPGSNMSTSKGGGKKKIDHQYELAKHLFSDHKKYGEAFRLAKDAKSKKWWATKIKNRLSSLVKKTREHMEEMGETGAGITSEDQINMDESNQFTNKWAVIRESFPWLWEMKALIDMRPNFIPVGVGHSQATIDMSEYAMSGSLHDDSSVSGHDVELEVERSQSEDIGGLEKEEDDDDLGDESVIVPAKRKLGADVDVTSKKTPARPGISPTILPPDGKKACNSITDKFTDAAKAEEMTMQRQLEVKKARIKADKELRVAKIQASAQIRISKHDAQQQLKIERLNFEREKAKMEHEIRMAQFHSDRGLPSASTSGSRHPSLHPLQVPRYHDHSVSHAGSSRSTGFSTPALSNIVLEDTAGLSQARFGFDDFDFSSSSEGSSLHLPFHPNTEDEN